MVSPLWFISALAIISCSMPISKELHREAKLSLSFSRVADNPSAYIGNTVIWGGIVREVRMTSEGMEIQILESPLRSDESPDSGIVRGEFIAIASEITDLTVFKKGERITVGGDIIGERIKDSKVEKFKYPVLLTKEFYLWDRAKKWWEPRPSSGWFWELVGASREPSLKNLDSMNRE